MDRKPKGYQGIGHETIGSDLLAVSNALHTPERVLSGKTLERLKKIEPARFYPVEWFLDIMEELDESIGPVALIRLGRKVFELSHQERVLKTARSARDIIYGIDGMYRHAHRGQGIGGWRALAFAPGSAELENTTPCHCKMEEGILLQALFALGAPSRIEQRECVRKGAQSCIYSITSVIEDERWTGAKSDEP